MKGLTKKKEVFRHGGKKLEKELEDLQAEFNALKDSRDTWKETCETPEVQPRSPVGAPDGGCGLGKRLKFGGPRGEARVYPLLPDSFGVRGDATFPATGVDGTQD